MSCLSFCSSIEFLAVELSVNLSVWLPVCLCLSVNLSVWLLVCACWSVTHAGLCLFVCLAAGLSVNLSVTHAGLCLFVSQFVCLAAGLSLNLSVMHAGLCLFVCQFVCLAVGLCLFVCPFVCLAVGLSLSVCQFVCNACDQSTICASLDLISKSKLSNLSFLREELLASLPMAGNALG